MAAPATEALPEGPSIPKSFRDKLGFPFGKGTWWVDSTTKIAYTKVRMLHLSLVFEGKNSEDER
jgi:hypothetical protein